MAHWIQVTKDVAVNLDGAVIIDVNDKNINIVFGRLELKAIRIKLEEATPQLVQFLTDIGLLKYTHEPKQFHEGACGDLR
jgi:hypothetical protein